MEINENEYQSFTNSSKVTLGLNTILFFSFFLRIQHIFFFIQEKKNVNSSFSSSQFFFL